MSEQSSASSGGQDVHDRLAAAFRNHSLEANFFLQAVAERLGVGAADFACLSMLLLEGPATAGRLAERTGLTTGAITGVIDRLVSHGRARRSADPVDRRRVVVEPIYERGGDVATLMAPLVTEARRMHAGFSSRELASVLRFITASTAMLTEQTEHLRAGAGGVPGSGAGISGADAVALTDAQLYLSGLGAHTIVKVGDTDGKLCRVDFSGAPPSVRTAGGRVTVEVRGRARAGRGQIVISSAVVWAVEIQGGASRVEVDLRGALVSRVTLRGGASRLEVDLPAPDRPVPVRVAGGASRVTIQRPVGVPAAVRLLGGASEVVVDGRGLRWAATGTRLGHLSAGMSGYEIEVSGGANQMVVETR